MINLNAIDMLRYGWGICEGFCPQQLNDFTPLTIMLQRQWECITSLTPLISSSKMPERILLANMIMLGTPSNVLVFFFVDIALVHSMINSFYSAFKQQCLCCWRMLWSYRVVMSMFSFRAAWVCYVNLPPLVTGFHSVLFLFG
jgi:hypothetical protein